MTEMPYLCWAFLYTSTGVNSYESFNDVSKWKGNSDTITDNKYEYIAVYIPEIFNQIKQTRANKIGDTDSIKLKKSCIVSTHPFLNVF
ncbi:Transposase IS66 family protein [Geobacillus stearothermophilus]|nr:Transposase IS66 family protein [Geobacillus stearothermophilus]